MKLALVGPLFPYRGGIAQFNGRLAQALEPQHQLMPINFSRLYPQFLFPGRTQYEDESTVPGLKSERLIDSLNPISWRGAGRRIGEWGAHAVIIHWWHPFFAPAFLGLSASLKRGIVKVGICHNVLPHEGNTLLKAMARRFLVRLDGAVVHSADEAREFSGVAKNLPLEKLFHPIYDQYPGSEIDQADARRRLNLNRDAQIVLNFGLIRPYKGVDILLKAAQRLADMDNLKIVVVGEIYRGRAELERLIGLAPPNMVQMIDRFVPNSEVALWFRAADVVVLPYRSVTQSGVVPIAYHCGRPVIATRVGGLAEVIKDGVTGILVPPEDDAKLAGTIRDFFNAGGRPDFSTGIKEMVAALSWDRYAEQLVALITRLKPKF